MKNFFLLAALISMLPSCAMIAHSPINRFESPETRGEGFELQTGLQTRNNIELTPDFTYRAPTLTDPSIEPPTHAVFAQGAIGLGRRFDLNINPLEARVGGKFQLTGAPASEAEAGNVPVSIYGGIGWDQHKDQGTYAFNNSTPIERASEMREIRGDIGLIFGYRPSSSVLIYGGPFAIWNLIRAKYQASTASNFSNENEATARSFGANVGVQLNFSDVWFMRVEAAGTKTSLGRADVGRGYYGFTVGTYL